MVCTSPARRYFSGVGVPVAAGEIPVGDRCADLRAPTPPQSRIIER
jgi:hypothetical protein